MAALGVGGAAAAGAAVWGTAPAEARSGDGRSFADAVVAAFGRHQLVAVGEVHGQQEHHDAMQVLLNDPRLPDVVDDIVVEFGNALYQPTMDRFTAGPAVENDDLRLVWRNTTQSPAVSLDAPCYEQFFRTVRSVNWPLPARRQIRVLLGDPPIDWSTVRTREEVESFDRDGHLVSVIEREVLAKGRRALVFYGSNHVKHAPPGAQGGGGIARIEQETGRRAYVILAGGHPRLASAPRRTVVPAAGTWLAGADSGEFGYLPGECGVPFGAFADALLYLGPLDQQTQSLWNPAIYLDPVFWAELQRRNQIMGGDLDLDQQYRRAQSVAWPVSTYPTCLTS
jgi:hypothetical protein